MRDAAAGLAAASLVVSMLAGCAGASTFESGVPHRGPAAARDTIAARAGRASSLAAAGPLPRPVRHGALALALDSILERAAPVVGGVSLLLVRGDTVLYDRSIGAIGPRTAIPAASAAKWMSGALLAALADEGRLSFDDSLGKFVEWGSPMARGIRIGRLYSHTSGLPRTAACLAGRGARLDACARDIVEGGLVRRPGERFAYGGASLQVAARVAELAGGASWVELFESRIAGPLGLERTRWPGAMPNVAGGLVTSRDDYARLLRMLLDSGVFEGRRVLSPAAVAAMERDWTRGALPEPPVPVRGAGYGIGMWIVRADSAGRAVELSSPGAYGFTPWIDRERDLLGVLAMRYDGGPEGFQTAAAVRAVVRERVK